MGWVSGIDAGGQRGISSTSCPVLTIFISCRIQPHNDDHTMALDLARTDEIWSDLICNSLLAQVGLVSGRWLQYQVRDCKPEDECGYVTLVRYTPECPTGKATALFNWKSAAMEVCIYFTQLAMSIACLSCKSSRWGLQRYKLCRKMSNLQMIDASSYYVCTGDPRGECGACGALINSHRPRRPRLAWHHE